jgi:hypothetical protein
MSGHIRRRGARSWELKYEALQDGGGRRTVYKSFKGTRREAQAELIRLLAQVAEGGHVDPTKLTVGRYVRERLAHWTSTGSISPFTARRYEQLIVGQIIPHLGGKLLQRLSTRDIEHWHAFLLSKGRLDGHRPNGTNGLSARTIGHAHRLLSKTLREAMRHGLIGKNVCTLERAPRVTTAEMVILTPEQVDALPDLLRGHAVEAPALLALYTGLRRGELLALRWDNVDLDEEASVSARASKRPESVCASNPPKAKPGCATSPCPPSPSMPCRPTASAISSAVLRLGRASLAATISCSAGGTGRRGARTLSAWRGGRSPPSSA